MTWESLIDRALTTFGYEIPRVKVEKYLQEAEQDFSNDTRCNVKTFTYMPNTGDGHIELPEDFVEIIGQVEFKTRTLDRLAAFDDFSRFKTTDTLKTGDPQCYFIRGDKMFIYPGVSTVGLITFSYVAETKYLDDALTYKFLQFDNLESDQFYDNESIKGVTTNTTAVVADVIDIEQKSGTLVLKSITGSGFQDNEKLIVTSDEQAMWQTTFGSFASLLEKWQNLGLGAIALVNGVAYNYDTRNSSPTIPKIYHRYLIDYAKAMICEDIGDQERKSQYYYQRYEEGKQKAKVQTTNKGISGPQTVHDSYGNVYL
tara:strand:- start:357 stop:1298 length:942 start_codon:yes stop_codon:yes gene_type:complete